MRTRALSGAIVLAIALVACGAPTPQRAVDQTTRALYEGDRDAAVSSFDEPLKTEVTRAQVGAISDAMHMLGAYKGLQPLETNTGANGRYDYAATFDRGTMLVMVRLDPDGRIAAYRVSPQEQQGS